MCLGADRRLRRVSPVKRYKTAVAAVVASTPLTAERLAQQVGVLQATRTARTLAGDPQLSEALSVVGAFVAHRKFAVSFIEHDLKVIDRRAVRTVSYFNLTRCMFGIASITTALEKLVSPPSNLAGVS